MHGCARMREEVTNRTHMDGIQTARCGGPPGWFLYPLSNCETLAPQSSMTSAGKTSVTDRQHSIRGGLHGARSWGA